jgi:thiol:disulfide interchange protein DsbD
VLASTLIAVAFVAAPAAAQDPVHWSAASPDKPVVPGAIFDVAVTAAIDDEWHVYSITQGPGGPIPTTITVPSGQPFSRAGAIVGPAPTTKYDPNFEIDTETHDGTATFTVPVRFAAGATATAALRLAITYQACTERLCLPPRSVVLSVRLTAGARTRVNAATPQLPTPNQLPTPQLPTPKELPTPKIQSATPKEIPTPKTQPPTSNTQPIAFGERADGWGAFLWLAVSMGALSLLTPCVFPMVPITVSYFTSHAAATRRGAIGSAAVYGAGIVLTFTVLGSGVAAIAGAAGLNRLAAKPWVNVAIEGTFVALALNLFGAYDLRLPVRVTSSLDGASRRRGASVTGPLLMAVTFTITSLTCTAAFLGTLLVVAAQGEWQRPMAGLLAYSATFALPFVVLAAAPQLVGQLPRSGPWLVRVKATMGFLEIAAAVKFLSNADLVWDWRIFTRGVVIVCWIATLAALAIYLARAPKKERRLAGAGSLVAALATVLFAAWLATGVSGRRLGELEAFLPPADYARGGSVSARGELPWISNDLSAALAEARATRRLVMIDFTGYTCTNCRWMEANMFPRPEIRAALDGFVRARLYTDGQGEIYERQQRFQEERFQTVALPLYAIVDGDARAVATFAGLTRDPDEFLRFLDTARR